MLPKPAGWQVGWLVSFVACLSAFLVVTSSRAVAGYGGSASEKPAAGLRKIIIIRHAQSLGNVRQRYTTHPANPGYFPAPLTSQGLEQAHDLGRSLKKAGFTARNIDAVLVSPLPRTTTTAHILADEMGLDKNRIVFDDRLIERNLGQRDGMLYTRFPEADHWYPANPEAFGGETSEQVQARVLAVWERAVALPGNGHVLIISHGQPIHSLTGAVSGQGHRIKNAEYVAIYADGNPVLKNEVY